MATTNKKTKKSHVYADKHLAGGYGPRAAKQGDEATLRRLVMSCLLWEKNAYCDGQEVVNKIKSLVPLVPNVADIAIEARYDQKLRHVPLLIVREMARNHMPGVAETLTKICKRPDEITEFISLYWSDNDKKKSLPAAVKRGLAAAFDKFDEYQLAKYKQMDKDIKLRDAMRLVHAKPAGDRNSLYKKLLYNELATPDTWEVGMSAAKNTDEKRGVWERLIDEGKLPAYVFLKNLRNMQEVKISRSSMAKAFDTCKSDMLLPIDFLKARKYAPDWTREIEDLMYRCAKSWPRLAGFTTLVIDVSGSMHSNLSSKSEFTRIDAAASMAVLAAECCDHVSVYVTAGSDHQRKHATRKVEATRGFSLADHITDAYDNMGGGGIFTRQVCDYIRDKIESPDRLLIFSDSQDCDLPGRGQPRPHGQRNYIIDVSSESHGVNYQGIWTAEISGWSENFLKFVAMMESNNN
jgi:ribosomal protein L25 (general stress protein Ctc)